MLERLFIKNFALIEELTVALSENLNVLTGETGTGKSIVVDAVSILLGGRAQGEFIRTGAERALLEGVFYFPPCHQVFEILDHLDLETDEQEPLVLSREISMSGRNTCRINGRTLPLNQYRQIGLAIVDIHGQHDHQALLQAEQHLGILDRFGGSQHLNLVRELRESHAMWLTYKKELDEIREKERERLQRVDFLTYQIQEIQQAKIRPGEMEELAREGGILANAEKITTNLNAAYLKLFGGERGLSAYDLVGKALINLNEVKKYDPALEKFISQLEPGLYLLEETAAELRDYLEGMEYSPVRLEQVEKRHQTIKDLCKKYGPTEEEVLGFYAKAQKDLEIWEKNAERAEELAGLLNLAWEVFENKGKELTNGRVKLARLLEEKVTGQLMELAMPHAQFAVRITPCEPSFKGLEQVEFLISPNPGEPLLPVAKIASGGELSRIMLALKTIIAGHDGIGTLIFDEIDSGLGGKAAQKVAEKLEEIGRSQQVICITHSPLIAALADDHMLLEKEVKGGRTKTILRHLEYLERVDELARMLGGDKQTLELKNHARQILKKKM